jgi:hypothetical protein
MSILHLVPVWFTLALLVPIALAIGGAYRRSKGRRTVICPETSESAFIALDARHAALMHVIGERPRRIQACSRWPERQACGANCLMGT